MFVLSCQELRSTARLLQYLCFPGILCSVAVPPSGLSFSSDLASPVALSISIHMCKQATHRKEDMLCQQKRIRVLPGALSHLEQPLNRVGPLPTQYNPEQ